MGELCLFPQCIGDACQVPLFIIPVSVLVAVLIHIQGAQVLVIVLVAFLPILMDGLKVAASVVTVIRDQVPVGLQHVGAHISIVIPEFHHAPVRHGLLQHAPLCIIFILYAYDSSRRQHAFQLSVLAVSIGAGISQRIHEFPQLAVAVPQPHFPACVVRHADQIIFLIVGKGEFSAICPFYLRHPSFIIPGIGVPVPVPVHPRKEPSFRGEGMLTSLPVCIPESFSGLCNHSLSTRNRYIQTSCAGAEGDLFSVSLADGQPHQPFLPDIHLMVMVPALPDAAATLVHGIVEDPEGHPGDPRYDQVFLFIDEIPGVHVDGVAAEDLAA